MVSPRRLVLAALVAWSISAAAGLLARAPLATDEAAYALIARGDQSWLYRSRGVVAMARAGRMLGDSELALRLLPTLASLLFVLAVAAVGARAFGARIGAIAAAVIAGAHPFLLRSFELLGDLPAAACLLGAIAIVLGELAGDSPPSYRLVGIAPLCAAAFYVRYGSAPVIALVGVAAIACWWRQIRARPGPVIATVVVLAALLAPFAIESIRATGSPFGILTSSAEHAGRTWFARGLLIYIVGDPLRQYGVLPPIAIVAAVWSLWRPSPRRRVATFLAAVGFGQIIVLGVVSHASARFVFVGVALLVVLGVDLLDRAVASPRWRRIAMRAVVASWICVAIALPVYERHLAHTLDDVMAAAAAIRSDAAGRSCTVAARALPQLLWYSGCTAGWRLVTATWPQPPVDAATRWYAADTPRRPVAPSMLAPRVVSLGPAWRLEPCYGSVGCAAATP